MLLFNCRSSSELALGVTSAVVGSQIDELGSQASKTGIALIFSYIIPLEEILAGIQLRFGSSLRKSAFCPLNWMKASKPQREILLLLSLACFLSVLNEY